MSKKEPDCKTGWHTTGTLKVLPGIDQIARRMEGDSAVEMHGMAPTGRDDWWSYDAVWMTKDGARVRSRLKVYNRIPGGEPDPALDDLDPRTYDPAVNPLEGYFHIFAKADRPWDPSWPSPLNVFLERKMKPSYASMKYNGHNPLHLSSASSLPDLFAAVSELHWLAVVLTHDTLEPNLRDLDGPNAGYNMPLVSRLPASLYGRVIDIRVLGGTWGPVNRILSKYKTYLPKGGAAILLSHSRRKGLSKSDLSFDLDRPLTMGGSIEKIADSLSRMLTSQVMENDSEFIAELGDEWTLLTEQERVDLDTALLQKAGVRIAELEQEKEELRKDLAKSVQFIDEFKKSGEALLEEAQKAISLKDEKVAENKRLRGELDRLLRMVRDSDLGEAMAARETAEAEVEMAEELLDEQSRMVAGLRRENGRLRRELARLGSTFISADSPDERPAPATWDDLFAQVSSLEWVIVGDVEGEVDKLRRQVQEENWLNRSWEALLALNEYALLKKQRGTEELPHFHAYLLDPQAEHVIPKTRYSANESKGVMMNGRFVNARTFSVPRQVDPSGKVVMEAHIRIGSGKPPAPRMHFFDDTSGNTGKIYVGHIGPHLPNYQTN